MTITDDEARMVLVLTKDLTERMKTSPLPYAVKCLVLIQTSINIFRESTPGISNAALRRSLEIVIKTILT